MSLTGPSPSYKKVVSEVYETPFVRQRMRFVNCPPGSHPLTRPEAGSAEKARRTLHGHPRLHTSPSIKALDLRGLDPWGPLLRDVI